MHALIQRVADASVTVQGACVGAIGRGLLVLLCAERGDTAAEAERLLARILKLRIFNDPAGRMNLSLQDVAGGLLVVSQFTLAADTRSGNRPSFAQASPPEEGRRLYDHFVAVARTAHPQVECGRFGAHMEVRLTNDGPVTIPMRVVPPAPPAG